MGGIGPPLDHNTDLTAGRTVPLTDDLLAELASDPEDERPSRSA
ncbi:hypothetical protein [Iamia sp. SCSIO 61187]|nr:hypothetical protein [Iamia sp. SCSIO 61187]